MKNATIPNELQPGYERLRSIINGYESLVVAFSGGVDSGLLAYVARDVLGDRMLPVIGISASLPEREREAALAFLRTHNIPFERIYTEEMSDSRYRENDGRRCYFCKSELFGKLNALARARGFSHIAYGANVDV